MRAKKSLGQNFLNSKKVLSDIVREANMVGGEEVVLEVGPGKGALTEALLSSGRRVMAVEKDDRLIPYLKEKFHAEIDSGKLEIVHRDVLNLDPKDHHMKDGGYSIVANIPYYITGLFLRKFLSGKVKPRRMILMLQKEVARRIVAKDGKESLLSLSVKVFGEPKYIKTVQAGAFSPAPAVDSAILLIENISKNFFDNDPGREEKFFELIKAGFAHKRKFLIGNLRGSKETAGISWEERFRRSHLSEKSRAEDLGLEDWRDLASY